MTTTGQGLGRRNQELALAAMPWLSGATGQQCVPVFEALGDLLQTGSTGTNVCDLVLALAWPRPQRLTAPAAATLAPT